MLLWRKSDCVPDRNCSLEWRGECVSSWCKRDGEVMLEKDGWQERKRGGGKG